MFKDIYFKQRTQFCLACYSNGLIYYGTANWSFRRRRPYANFFFIIYYEVFLNLFLNRSFQKIFCVLVYQNQEAFSEKCSLISGVVQDLVKICKKYMEVNHFLLLTCTLEK